jgi:predicted alpha-1,2-mannosidase
MKTPEAVPSPSLSMRWRCLGAALALFCSLPLGRMLSASTLNLTPYVNPFIGTEACPSGNYGFTFTTGDVFPGADYPTGMFQWSPDTTSNLPGGYNYLDNTIKGFSVRHFSGRGISVYQDFPFMPYVGTVSASPATSTMYRAGYSHSNESASPGYYSVTLNSNIKVELTASMHTGAARFTFPSSTNSTIMVNSGGSVSGNSSNTGITIVPGSNEMTGYASANIGGPEAYTIYFVVMFDQPFASFGTWNGGTVNNGSTSSTGSQSGAFATFGTTVVNARAAISFVSLANAEANLAAENPAFNFSGTQAACNTAWNTVLNKVQVSGGTAAQMTEFYTALYHCFFHPNVFDDVNGQYMGMDKTVHTVTSGHTHQYEGISGWDQYRSGLPLRAIIAQNEANDVCQSLVNWGAQGGGGLPRWEQTYRNSNGMEGEGQSTEIAACYALGATHFDTASALSYMVNDLSVVGTTSDGNTVHGNLSNYLSLGFDPSNASNTLDLATADFAVAQFAKSLGDATDYNKFLAASGNWQNVFNSSSGYMQRRNSDGTWASGWSPSSSNGFTEGTSAQYTFDVPYNYAGLVSAMGGNAAVVSRLNTLFTQNNAGAANTAYDYVGNEPSEQNPWVYDFVGDPAGAQLQCNKLETELWTDLPSGIPGNDDGGAIDSLYIFAALGFYPEIPGVGGVVLGSPMFPSAVINLENGNTLTITGTNASPSNPYVQSMTLNGVSSSSLWIPINTLLSGATLDFTLGSSPSSWGTAPADAPPSFPSSGGGGGGTEAPFGGTPAVIPGTVQAENYDTGGQGLAYNVTSINGTDTGYRSDGVDLETTSDAGGGDDLGWTTGGQWFKYTVNVASAGIYTVSFRVAALSAVTGAFHLANSSGANLSGPVNVPATGGWQIWTTVTATVTLPAGQQVLTLDQDNGGWNLNDMVLATSGGDVATPAFSPGGGTYSSAQLVIINDSTSGATIRYTTDGSTPSETSGTVYSGSISIGTTTTLNAIAYESGMTDSSVASAIYTINISSLPPPVISSAGTTSGTVGSAFSYQITASHSPTSYGATGLPAGLSVNASTGLISGTPSAPGTSSVALSATNASGTGNQALTLTVTQTQQAANPWELVGAADFNGDGKPDLIWQNTASGQRAIWLMNGTTYLSSVSLGTVATDWDIVGAADFNGDGKPDLIWQNIVNGQRAIWLMNGTTYVSSVSLGTVTSDWQIAGAADFNKNGNSDLIWQNTKNGQRAIWLMNGATYVSSVSLGTVTTDWDIVGAADFNGDGNSDLIWQNTLNGQRAFWLMNGTTYVSSVAYTLGLPQLIAPSFNPAGGTYTSAQNVTISDATSSVSIRYTTDGSTPSETNGTLYSGPVNIGSTTTLQAIAYANGYSDSPVASASYTVGSTITGNFWVAGSTIPTATKVLTLKFLNRTNGAYPDSQVYWSFQNGSINELHTIAEQGTYDMPANSSGRLYMGLGAPPNGANPNAYWDFIEFTIGPTQFNGNTTRVDAFGLKIAMRLHCADGYDVSVGENLATFQESRTATFNRFKAAVPAEFQNCAIIEAPYRIVEPGAAGFNAGGQYATYYDSYINQIWANNGITIPKPGPNGSGLGAYPDLSAAIFRHVGAAAGSFNADGSRRDPNMWNDSSTFYTAAPAHYYAKFWHDNAINGKAYGFPYDDVGGYSSYISHSNPQWLQIAVGF